MALWRCFVCRFIFCFTFDLIYWIFYIINGRMPHLFMIDVTRLNGKKYWVNPHMIESMESNPDLTLNMLSGRQLIIKEKPAEIIDKIVEYRKKIGINTQEG